ncbi:hypothetical protein [Desulfobacter postgatei]|jgi:hypothetical protein|uniref:hypothetical protein n=1 Tax=Desulfobacter postgatei TaxID=2293 RepID=UPI002A35D2C5|nr:hypothetical protein [Desulfobacter postgatei]MDX9963547.1 hypothetical protein [Desulfobacter postgatei]
MGKKSKAQKPQEKETNGWDVLLRVVDLTYSLLNSGNIIGAILLGFIFWLLMVTFRMPEGDLSPFIHRILDILQHASTGNIILISALGVSLISNRLTYKTYKAEIKRLIELRYNLIHGLDNGSLKSIENHTSCDTDI